MADEIERDGEIARAAHRRSRLAVSPVPRPDCAARGWLEPGEQLIACRSPATVDRRITVERHRPPSGDLYVTSQRLVLLGTTPVSIALTEIQDAAIVGEDLCLLLGDGVGVTISCDRSAVLRSQIAEARASRREATEPVG